jgi:hypothetical protein
VGCTVPTIGNLDEEPAVPSKEAGCWDDLKVNKVFFFFFFFLK